MSDTRPLGPEVDATPARRPERAPLDGRFVRLEPLHAARPPPALWHRHSMTDREWPAARRAFALWLSPDNFDRDGRQRRSLAALRRAPAA